MSSQRVALEITQLVAEHHAAVYRYAYRLTGSACDAEDLAQQTFLIAHQKLGQLRAIESSRSWLFAMVRNLFLKGQRRKRMLSPEDLEIGLDSLPADVPGDDSIDREKLQQALNALAPEQRLVLVMFYFQDCSYREIAAELQLPPGTVMSRLSRAKAQLRKALLPSAAPQTYSVLSAPSNGSV